MAENINIPIKVSGDTLSAIEFNQIVDKTNNMINEFNNASTVSQITWLTGQTKPTIDADVIIGELQEGDTHYITKYKSGINDVAIINNINKQFPSYHTIKNTTLLDPPYIVKAQGDKFICLNYNHNKLFRLNADLSLDDTFIIIENNIYDFFIQSDNTILISFNNNNNYTALYKLDINGNIDQTFENTKVQFNQYYQIQGLKKQSTGKIIGFICEYDLSGNTISSYITRFNSDGSLDNTFNNFQTGQYLQGIQILNDDSIVLYDNNDQKLHKLSSDGIEDVSYSNNYYINFSGVSFYYLLDLNTPFTDGSILFNNYDNIIKVNSNGTIDNTYNTNIAAIHIYPYVNIISHNNKLILINIDTDSLLTEIVVIAEDGSIESSIPLTNLAINIYESNNSTYLVIFFEIISHDYPKYLYSQLYNSEFSPIFTTLTEKPHYALQEQLEYPIFTPNNYYIPAIINLQHEIALVNLASGGEGTNFNYYNFNDQTETFDIIYSDSNMLLYQNSLLFTLTYDSYYHTTSVLTYDLNEIPGINIYDVNLINNAIERIGYDSRFDGLKLSRMLVNGKNVIAVIKDTNTIEWFDETTGEVISNWSWSGLTQTELTYNYLFKLNDTKVCIAELSPNSMYLYLKYVLDLETKQYTVLDNRLDMDVYMVVYKILNNNGYSITFQYDDYNNNVCNLPNGTRIEMATSFVPVCILESLDEELIIGYNESTSNIQLYNNKLGSYTNTNIANIVRIYLFDREISYNFQNYDFYKLGDYYYLILNILGDNGYVLKSSDAITWEIIIGEIPAIEIDNPATT